MYLRLRVSGVLLFAATVMPYSFGCVATQRANLRETNIAMTTAHSARDLPRVASFFAVDTITLPPNSPVVSGKEATMKLWSEVYANPGFAVSCELQEAAVSRADDLGYTIGTYELTVHDADGKPVTDRGRYVSIWQKHGEEWKLIVDIWNSSQPLAAP